jgi:hydrogenase expression/formation protein HypE
VAGDTKVVESGSGDGLFINTTGIGSAMADPAPSPSRIRPGDTVLVSGPIGRHGITILAAREELGLAVDVLSDTAPLAALVEKLLDEAGPGVHALRDPTRGGVAGVLNELATASSTGILLKEGTLPVPAPVEATCELLGLDPLYVANEGILVAVVDPGAADVALSALRGHPLGAEAAAVGTVVAEAPGLVRLRTGLGGTRIVDLLPGDQLPRIC